jgi:hypothetical protein
VGYVLRPSLQHVEADNPDRIAVLTRQQFPDDGFQIGVFVGFPPDAAESAKIIQNQVDVLVVAMGARSREPGSIYALQNSTLRNRVLASL